MAVKHRRRNRPWREQHPYEYYNEFGKQPFKIEIQLGCGLFPLIDKSKDAPLIKEISYLRNHIDAEYGLPLSNMLVRDNMCLNLGEYRILLNGTDIGVCDAYWGGYLWCFSTDNVKMPIEGEKRKDPVSGRDAILIPNDKERQAIVLGYEVIEDSIIIRMHFYEIIKQNITKLLDQCMFNNLVEKVRKINPDVVSYVFYINNFSVSELKLILNLLLEEDVSIRDMNTILETIADYIPDDLKPYELAEKIRQRLAISFISKYLEDDEKLHLIKVSQPVSEKLAELAYYPDTKVDLPYCAFDPPTRRKFLKGATAAISLMKEKHYKPVLICVSSVRFLVRKVLCLEMPDVRVISDMELYACKQAFPLILEGELNFDGE